MVTYFIASLLMLSLFLCAMALGVIFSNKPLKGSCGGLGKIMGKDCEICKNKDKCERRKAQ